MRQRQRGRGGVFPHPLKCLHLSEGKNTPTELDTTKPKIAADKLRWEKKTKKNKIKHQYFLCGLLPPIRLQ